MGPGRVQEGYHGNEVGGEAVGWQQRGVVSLATVQVRHQVFERFDFRHALQTTRMESYCLLKNVLF